MLDCDSCNVVGFFHLTTFGQSVGYVTNYYCNALPMISHKPSHQAHYKKKKKRKTRVKNIRALLAGARSSREGFPKRRSLFSGAAPSKGKYFYMGDSRGVSSAHQADIRSIAYVSECGEEISPSISP